MSNHHTGHILFKDFFKRIQFKRIDLIKRFVDNGQIKMRIHINIAMAWKMFGTCQHTIVLKSFHILNAEAGYFKFIFSKTSIIDNRIIGIVV